MLDRPRNLFILYQVPGHASSIAKVRFTSDNKYLIVLGRFNRTITQYSIQKIDKGNHSEDEAFFLICLIHGH